MYSKLGRDGTEKVEEKMEGKTGEWIIRTYQVVHMYEVTRMYETLKQGHHF